MKNLIVYATKHGTAKKCAEMLKSKLNVETVLAENGYSRIHESNISELADSINEE